MLARIADDTLASEAAEARAAVAELAASASEARANAVRARELREKGSYSAQLQTQYQTPSTLPVRALPLPAPASSRPS